MDGIDIPQNHIDEYYVIKTLNGMSYKLFNIIRLMEKEQKVDVDGFVVLSYGKIKHKLGLKNNVVRIIDDLDLHPEIVIVIRGNTSTPNKFKISAKNLIC